MNEKDLYAVKASLKSVNATPKLTRSASLVGRFNIVARTDHDSNEYEEIIHWDAKSIEASLPTIPPLPPPIPPPSTIPAKPRERNNTSVTSVDDLQNQTLSVPPPLPSRSITAVSPYTLMTTHKAKLPLRLAVNSGNYGFNQFTTFAEEEEFSAYFLHEMDFVLAETDSKKQYQIPLASSFNFGCIFSPCHILDDALKGYSFDVAKLMDVNPCPKLIATKTSYKGENFESSVEIDDILSIESIVKVGKKRFIKCKHCITGLTKMLREDWQITFTTRPSKLFLSLDVLFKYMSCPIQVLVNPPKTVPQRGLPSELSTNAVACLLELGKDVTLVCGRMMTDSTVPVLFSLPANFEIDLNILECQAKKFELLQIESSDFYRSFNIQNVNLELQSYVTSKSLKSSYEVQLLLMMNLDENCLSSHNKRICPPLIEKFLPLHSVQLSKTLPKVANNTEKTKSSETTKSRDSSTRLNKMEETVQAVVADLEICKERIRRVLEEQSQDREFKLISEKADSAFNMVRDQKQLILKIEDRLAAIEKQQEQNREVLKKGHGYIDTPTNDYQPLIAIQSKLAEKRASHDTTQSSTTMSPRLTSQSPSSTSGAEDDKLAQQNNIQYLLSLSPGQVIQLLKSFGMDEYIPQFEAEKICGQTLAELQEEDLAKELQMKSKLHRIRLMQVITGKVSAFAIINKKRSN